MLETLIVLGFTIVGGGFVFKVAPSAISPVYKFVRYKYNKRSYYKKIDKAIIKKDYEEVKKYFSLLKDLNYDKYIKRLKLKGMNEDILYNKELFDIHFNPTSMVKLIRTGDNNFELFKLNERIENIEASLSIGGIDL